MKFSFLDTLLAMLVKGIGAISILLMNLIVLKFYGSDLAGKFFTYLSIIYISSSFIRHGTDTCSIKYNAKLFYERSYSDIWFYFVSHFNKLLYLFLILISISALNSFSIFRDAFIVGAIFFHALVFYISFFIQASLNVKVSIFLNSILIPLVFSILVFVFSTNSSAATLYFYSCVFSFLISLLIFINMVKSAPLLISWKNTLKVNKVDLESSRFWLVSVLNISMQWVPVLIAGTLMSFNENSVFTTAQRASMVISFFLIAVNSYMVPRYSKLCNDTQGLAELIKLVSKASTIISISSITAFIIMYALIALINYDFELGSDFISFRLVFIVLSIGQLFSSIFGSVGYLLQLNNYANYYAKAICVSLALLVVSSFVLGYYNNLDLFNFAVVVSVSTILQNLISWYILKLKTNINTLKWCKLW